MIAKIFGHNCRTQQTYHWIVEVTKNYILKAEYTMGKNGWMLWALQMYHIILFWSMLSQAYYVIVDCGVSESWYGIEVVYWINAIYKRFLFQLITTVQLTGSKWYDTHMEIRYTNSTANVSLSRQFQKNLSNTARKHRVINQEKNAKLN